MWGISGLAESSVSWSVLFLLHGFNCESSVGFEVLTVMRVMMGTASIIWRFIALMMEVIRTSEALVNIYMSTQYYNLEVCHFCDSFVWNHSVSNFGSFSVFM
jgi:hypothetical protein